MRNAALMSLAVTMLLTANLAAAQARGSGSGGNASTPPATKDAGPAAESATLPARDLPIEPRHGFFGAPGAASDALGPSRLGSHGDRAVTPSYGEAAPQVSGGGEPYQTWRSGDLVRSRSSADVRAARQQQAPDLEWASTPAAAAGDTQRPNEPYGVDAQKQQLLPRK